MTFYMKLISRIFMCLFFVTTANVALAGDSATDARTFVENLSTKAVKIVESTDLSVGKKYHALKEIFDASVDTDWMSRFALGANWRTLAEEERTRYQTLYHQFLMLSYVPRFKEFNNQKLNIKKYNLDNSKNQEYTVYTEIINIEGKVISVNYRIHKNKQNQFKIFDVVAEGVSLITTQRSDFGTLVSRKGSQYFLDMLQSRVERMEAEQEE